MKQILISIFILVLASSCSSVAPAPTATTLPTSASTPLPTETPTSTPSATPDVIAPVLNDLQKMGINASHKDGVWILIFGGVEIPYANLNEDGLTVTTDNGEINVPLAEMNTRIENANGVLIIKDASGKAMTVFDSVLGKWINPDQMTDEQKSDLAPASIDGFTKSNWSTVVDGILIYRNAEGIAQLAYNPSTGEKSTLPEAGTIEFDLSDGTKLEMRAFIPNVSKDADAQTKETEDIRVLNEMMKYLVNHGVAWGETSPRTSNNHIDPKHIDPNYIRSYQIPKRGHGAIMVSSLGPDGIKNSFWIGEAILTNFQEIEGFEAFCYPAADDELSDGVIAFVGMSTDRFEDLLDQGKVYIPPKPQK
jgi:hypothetical protein